MFHTVVAIRSSCFLFSTRAGGSGVGCESCDLLVLERDFGGDSTGGAFIGGSGVTSLSGSFRSGEDCDIDTFDASNSSVDVSATEVSGKSINE